MDGTLKRYEEVREQCGSKYGRDLVLCGELSGVRSCNYSNCGRK